MPLDRSPRRHLFRTLVAGMLMLAIVAKPLLAELCNMHALTHVLPAVSQIDRHVDTAAEARSDRDHASGAHQFLHALDAPGTFVEPVPVLMVVPQRFAHLAPPAYRALEPPARGVESPFRPPIA